MLPDRFRRSLSGLIRTVTLCLGVLFIFQPVARAADPSPTPSTPKAAGSSAAITTEDQRNWWAFQPLCKPPLPPVQTATSSLNSVDRFIVARQRSIGATLLPPADKATLLRRAYFNLIGLPPSPLEVEAFQKDRSSHAFSDVVDRLLASPRYGERWGRHWMDVVRYADTAGDNADYPVPEAYRYRDYIIESFNSDKPYDQFIREQLAGDLLAEEGPPERYAERVVATGFLALSRRYATAPFELMHLTIEDAIETTGRTFLGLSLRCARCHDHKFDPVSARDYYGLYGFFASTRFPYAGSEEFQSKNLPRTGFVPLLPPVESARPIEENRKRLEALHTQLDALEKSSSPAKTNAALKAEIEAQLTTLRRELKRRERSGALPDLPVAYAVTDDRPVNQAIQAKGDPGQPGEVIPRCLPAFLSSGKPLVLQTNASGRRELAAWISSAENPLTARVMANRVWHYHFGRGLVGSPSNFGLRGEKPTHPELLDHLASHLIESGWSVKSLHRLILNSAAWQQQVSTQRTGPDMQKSLWVGVDRQRLDAESLRDAMMTVAGTLDLTPPTAHPFPPIEDWHWTQHNPFKAVYESNHRSVYLMRQRLQRHPYLSLFDAPDANMSTDIRAHATVPQQALYLMNNPFVRSQAAAFASRVMKENLSETARIRASVLLAWNRPPTHTEEKQMAAYLHRFESEARKAGLSSSEALQGAWESEARILITANEFLYLD